MGKIFVGQDKLNLVVTVGQDITGATATLIKYIKPSGDTGSFSATITDATTGELTYDVQAGDLDQYSNWIFWAHITYADAQIGIGEPVSIHVFKEGEL